MDIRALDGKMKYGIIEFGEGSNKLSSDFRYIFADRLNLGEIVSPNLGGDLPENEYDAYICCTYDRKQAAAKLHALGLEYQKDYYFADDFFCLLDDWKEQKIAYKAYSGKVTDTLKAVLFGYTAKHGIILPEDPHRDALAKGHKMRTGSVAVQRLVHALYLIPAMVEAFPQIFARGNDYKNYDHISFLKASDAVRFKQDHPSAAGKVITVEELKSHTIASSYMRAVYYDRRQNSCACDTPFNTLWIGRNGTTRLCDCPDYLDISCGNIGVTNTSDVWDSPLAKIIRLSVINNTYTFCSRKTCGKLSEGKEQTALLDRRSVPENDHPGILNIANDYVCNLHCPSCRKCIYTKNDAGEQAAIDSCIDAIINSGWLEKADKLLIGGGGEVFLSKNYKKLLYGGSDKRSSVIIMTNGTLFTRSEWEKLEGKYEHIGFMVSVDAASKGTYEKVRCGGNFDNLMKNMDFLSNLRKENKVSSVKVIMIVQKANYKEIPEFIRWAKEKGFDGVNLSHIRNWGTFEDGYFYEEVSMFDKSGEMKSELSAILKEPICNDPIVHMSWDVRME